MIFGIFFLNQWLVANLAILKAGPASVLNHPAFLRNHLYNQIGMTIEIILFIIVIGISVLKPWKKKNNEGKG